MLLLYLGDKVVKKIIKGCIVILCMVIIFSFSMDNSSESTRKSEGVILEVTSFLGFDFTSQQQQHIVELFFVPVRKAAHFFIYFVLGITLISFLREFSIPIRKLILLSIFLAFLYACSDEVHQLFVPGRSGQVSDVLLDTIGASVGVGLYYLLFRKKLKEIDYEQKENFSYNKCRNCLGAYCFRGSGYGSFCSACLYERKAGSRIFQAVYGRSPSLAGGQSPGF